MPRGVHTLFANLASYALNHLSGPVGPNTINPARSRFEQKRVVATCLYCGARPSCFTTTCTPLLQNRTGRVVTKSRAMRK
ncbi:MAG: hypothetical protein Q9181_002810 [Wetmoreana brouardii]